MIYFSLLPLLFWEIYLYVFLTTFKLFSMRYASIAQCFCSNNWVSVVPDILITPGHIIILGQNQAWQYRNYRTEYLMLYGILEDSMWGLNTMQVRFGIVMIWILELLLGWVYLFQWGTYNIFTIFQVSKIFDLDTARGTFLLFDKNIMKK